MREWKGDWSDLSKCWTEKTKAQVDLVKDTEDGVFWISMRDFDKFFYSVSVCFYHDRYQDTTIADWHEEGGFGAYKFAYNPEGES